MRRPRSLVVPLLASAVMPLVGCAVDPLGAELEEGPSELVLPDAWARGLLDDDPLLHHQPAGLVDEDCPPSTWGYEDGRLEVQTGACAYAWLVQPALTELSPGDTLAITSWHQGLDAPLPSEGHLALVVDGEVLWEATAPIPSSPEVFDAEVVIHRHVPEGSEVGVHLHNHGYNSWSVGAVTRWPGALTW